MKATCRLALSNLQGRTLCRRCQDRAFSSFLYPPASGWRRRDSPTSTRPQIRFNRRLASTHVRKSIAELPQGLQQPLEPFIEKEASKYSPVIDEVLQNQRRFPNCVLLTRLGQFYELYFTQAEEIAPLLNIKLTARQTKNGPISFAGFPYFQLDRYLKILVEEHQKYVALCEEYRKPVDDTSSKVEFERRVVRIITPGTLIDERFMDPYENNFLLAVYTPDVESIGNGLDAEDVGLAWLDLSTGDFFTQQTDISALPGDIARIAPREILLNEDLRSDRSHALFSTIEEERHFITYEPFTDLSLTVVPQSWDSLLESPIPPRIAKTFTLPEIRAAEVLLRSVKSKLMGTNMRIQPPIRKSKQDIMMIDANTLRALEIKRTMREGNVRGSLLSAIRRTVTKSGARLFADMICSPVTSIREINRRLDLVDTFLADSHLLADIIYHLRQTHDSQRLVQRFSLGRGDSDDLLSLARTIRETEHILARLREQHHPSLDHLIGRIVIPEKLCERIEAAIDEEGLFKRQRLEEMETAELGKIVRIVEGQEVGEARKTKKKEEVKKEDVWIMKKTASPRLRQLHDTLSRLSEEKEALQTRLSDEFGAKSLNLRWTPGLSHIVHVNAKDAKVLSELEDAKPISASKTTRSFQLPDWTYLGTRIDQTKLQIRIEETRWFTKLRLLVIHNLLLLRRNARVLDELDVATSFATLAKEQKWTRPVLNVGTAHRIVGGRHPIVEAGLWERGQMFVNNDCYVGGGIEEGGKRLWVITGPNMGGKSTFLRQNAVISILAQVGSYVPAEHAEIGIVDQVFSRVGSADNLYHSQSTFMLEMLETATILRHATHRSFVIMDEVGRGTTSLDGIAIAFACLHHLYYKNQCRTLFATHFHELAHMIASWPKAGNLCTDVAEGEDGTFHFLHLVKEGINVKSQALKVATLAGLPPQTLRIAAQTLEYLEGNSQPIVNPHDEFLTAFIKDDINQSIIDPIAEARLEEEKIEDLKEVVHIEDENSEEEQQEISTPQLYDRILSDREKRRMEKVHAKVERDAEKERKRSEKEGLKAEKEKEKANKKLRQIVAKLGSPDMSASAEG